MAEGPKKADSSPLKVLAPDPITKTEAQVRQAIRRHVGKKVTFCDTDHLICADCVCAVCAYPCLSGLLYQLADGKNVHKADAGVCNPLYDPSCYPCVITDGCVCLGIISVCTGLIANNDNAQFIVDNTVQTGIRAELLTRAYENDGALGNFATSGIQQFCGPCFCTPCHNAALIRELEPEGYGSCCNWINCGAEKVEASFF